VGPWEVVMVLLSTTLYAGAAVAVAANVFGQESVVFADSGSLRGAFTRRMMKPSARPSVSMSLLVTALLFPTWFFVQSALSPGLDETAVGQLYGTAWLMPLLFVLLPVAILIYWKVDIVNTFSLRMPRAWHFVAAILIGLSAWVPAHEVNVLQQSLLGTPETVVQSAERLVEALKLLPPATALLILALLPAVCEELLFRGFLLGGLRSSTGKWPAIVASAAVFGVFHFFVFRFAVTAGLGVILAYLCWQSRSILPAMVTHALHNTLGVLSVIKPEWQRVIGLPDDPDSTTEWAHLPLWLILVGSFVLILGLYLASRPGESLRRSPASTA
jgi:membrane protease YdiL (CAAX protease family)